MFTRDWRARTHILYVCAQQTAAAEANPEAAAAVLPMLGTVMERQRQYEIYMSYILRNTEAYKFNGLVYRAVYNGIEPSGFATISVKCVRLCAIATRSGRGSQREKERESV